jgi:hypothetical protein
MKTEEDEAFDELARKQGAWGGGFKAKQAMAADKLQEPAQEPVGSLSVRYFRGSKAMTNTDFDYTGDLPEGDYELYTAPPQPAQEPVGQVGAIGSDGFVGHIYDDRKVKTGDKLYTAPPKREWVGLTDEELHEICNSYYYGDRELVKLIEAKLKEKNNGT